MTEIELPINTENFKNINHEKWSYCYYGLFAVMEQYHWEDIKTTLHSGLLNDSMLINNIIPKKLWKTAGIKAKFDSNHPILIVPESNTLTSRNTHMAWIIDNKVKARFYNNKSGISDWVLTMVPYSYLAYSVAETMPSITEEQFVELMNQLFNTSSFELAVHMLANINWTEHIEIFFMYSRLLKRETLYFKINGIAIEYYKALLCCFEACSYIRYKAMLNEEKIKLAGNYVLNTIETLQKKNYKQFKLSFNVKYSY